ncbi:spore coat protein [Thermohalobacter berrensis]|uniref:Coat protein F n=1 Tax=Thermohalobacter berrensis TaxID=99594 RepID=A0A419SZH7_9FIRM|nr:spore coat protein [Thermohalobacter berrensis]RKD30612.1 coat protein F [Thermohalobacter berrensis]
MQERDIVNDVLAMTKASLSDYTKAISECSNQQLRGALQQLRGEAEQFQSQLAQIATQKNYYQPAGQVSSQERQQLKSQLTQAQGVGGGRMR